MTPRALFAAWKTAAMPGAEGARTSSPEPGRHALLRLSGEIGAGRVRLELDVEQRFRFEAWMTGQGWAIAGDWDPANGYFRDMTHRILWAAWRDREILRRLAPYAAQSNPANGYLAGQRATGLPGQPTS